MPNCRRAILCLFASFLFVGSASAGPYDAALGTTIDTYLQGQGSPLYGLGSQFFTDGVFDNVDPRLIVAIAGAESSYGLTNPCGFDAWGFLPTPCTSGYSSYGAGVDNVTLGIRQNYLNAGFTLSAVAAQYCAGPCSSTWLASVTSTYVALGGDVTDLTFTAPGSLIDFEQYASSSPSYFAALTSPIQPLVVFAGTITATFTGGTTLSGATNLPGDQSTTYGTASPYCTEGCLPTITIDFSAPVINFSLYVINGNTVGITYTVVDDVGSTSQISLVPNLSSGLGTVALPTTDRVLQVQIYGPATPPAGACCTWDFFIDNVAFAPAP